MPEYTTFLWQSRWLIVGESGQEEPLARPKERHEELGAQSSHDTEKEGIENQSLLSLHGVVLPPRFQRGPAACGDGGPSEDNLTAPVPWRSGTPPIPPGAAGRRDSARCGRPERGGCPTLHRLLTSQNRSQKGGHDANLLCIVNTTATEG
jgi:hypothetical protein